MKNETELESELCILRKEKQLLISKKYKQELSVNDEDRLKNLNIIIYCKSKQLSKIIRGAYV
jgi:hypothetical protein